MAKMMLIIILQNTEILFFTIWTHFQQRGRERGIGSYMSLKYKNMVQVIKAYFCNLYTNKMWLHPSQKDWSAYKKCCYTCWFPVEEGYLPSRSAMTASCLFLSLFRLLVFSSSSVSWSVTSLRRSSHCFFSCSRKKKTQPVWVVVKMKECI